MGGEVDEVRHHSETDLRKAPNRRELHVVGTVLSESRNYPYDEEQSKFDALTNMDRSFLHDPSAR